MSGPQRSPESPRYFITVKDVYGSDEDGTVRVVQGSLLRMEADDSRRGSRRPPWLTVLDTEQALRLELQDLREIGERIAGLLEPVTDGEERLALVNDESRLQGLSRVRKGDRVRVQVTSASVDRVLGVVRYRGPLGKSKGDSGILFGVELLGSATGKGFTDGSFKGQKFFSCAENSGVFVPVSRIELADGPERAPRSRTPVAPPKDADILLQEGDKIFFVMEDSRPTGTVVFCGYLPKRAKTCAFVGILLDKPVGSWDGYINEKKICDIPSPDYGILLPQHKVFKVSGKDETSSFLSRGGADKLPQNRLLHSRQRDGKQAKFTESPAEEPLPPPAPSPVSEERQASPSPQEESLLLSLGPGSLAENLHYPPLEINSMVEVHDPPIFGVIRWIGEHPDFAETIAGLEVEDPMPSVCTDGTYRGSRYFHCAPSKALFVKLRHCRPDSRFCSLQFPANQAQHCNSIAFRDYASERVDEDTPPDTGPEGGEQLMGWKKGIQGHCNSCYLDATLFCMFAFSSVLDTILLRPRDKNDSDSYSTTRDLLRTEIVNPLRKNGYVCATKVMALRKILEVEGRSSGFTSEEKDPEEFLHQLFQVLKVDPLFKIRSSGKEPHGCIFYQIFMERKQSVSVPSVQQLLEWSLVTSDLKFTEAPSCLIIQMPRNGKNFKMFTTILPTLELDITNLLEDTPRECCICQALALVECRDCYEDLNITPGGIKQYCMICNKQVHCHRNRRDHEPQTLQLPEELLDQTGFPSFVPRQTMQLFAVLCIETSHYVAFTKYGPGDADWSFFDSMADREGGQNGFNIPQVTSCPEVAEYLNMNPQELQSLDLKSMPSCARRLLCDAYMCLYHSPTLSLYK
ncbi:LOW QUALITY PROTEIN: ubiquitin carboxyl-terminal hydrolase CYLD-like [Microcaecilia unicolor]|uniref:Ubiquitin carboxyl-terminal hydrolase CYLD n=1 Tax=Microcaecilia unicolor TaxID=1415580 RepID=A0A6P7X0C3_9AMPH|nr:LOW QUALITY PROTEIN: ubiquitin carboxyl-terminal hydrolase CYLD-like [Microcaecilia unicolor]